MLGRYDHTHMFMEGPIVIRVEDVERIMPALALSTKFRGDGAQYTILTAALYQNRTGHNT